MTITPDQADRLKRDATEGPWIPSKSGYIGSATGVMIHDGQVLGDTDADTELIAAAPDLAQTVIDQANRIEELEEQLAGVQWECGVEQATGTTQWFRSRPMAEAHAEVRGAFRLVRRLVGPVEVVE